MSLMGTVVTKEYEEYFLVGKLLAIFTYKAIGLWSHANTKIFILLSNLFYLVSLRE